MSDQISRPGPESPAEGMAPPVGPRIETETGSFRVESGAPSPVPHLNVLRLCRHCSAETVTDAAQCPVCGTPYLHRSWWTRPWVWLVAGAVAVVAVGAIGLTLWNNHQERLAEEQRIAAERVAAEQEAAEQEAAREAARDAAAAAVAERELTVPQIERAITKMARGHSRDGMIEGWPQATQCSPAAGQSIENLSKSTTSFSCFVITERLGNGRSSGHYYHALMNWDTGRYTYGYGDG